MVAISHKTTTTVRGNTTTVRTGLAGTFGHFINYREQVYENVRIPTYSTTTTVSGGVRSITNLDLQSTWGQPIPLLWGHTRVKALPIWASMPEERTNGAPRPPAINFGAGDVEAAAG